MPPAHGRNRVHNMYYLFVAIGTRQGAKPGASLDSFLGGGANLFYKLIITS